MSDLDIKPATELRLVPRRRSIDARFWVSLAVFAALALLIGWLCAEALYRMMP